MLVCLWYHRGGGRGETKFPSIIILRGESKKKTRQLNWLSAPPPVLQRPFQRNRPIPQSKSDIRYARLFMISLGGRSMTKFSFTHIFKGRIKINMQQSNGFQRHPRSSSAHSNAIDPFPTVNSTSDMLFCLWYHRGGAAWLNFCSLIFLRGE